MSEVKISKAPVGTQRFWESTGQTWIKTHDNTIFDNNVSPWIPRPSIPRTFQELFDALDIKGRKIVAFKDPVDGDLWLTKEFENFETQSGKRFRASDFKQYSKFDKRAAQYSFDSELTKRLIDDKIKLNEKIADSLVELNYRRKTELLREGEDVGEKLHVLTDEEIKNTKIYIRDNFKFDDEKLTLEDVHEIDQILTRVLKYLEQGENFEGDQEKVFNDCKKVLDELKNGPYVNISTVRDVFSETLTKLNTTFEDNWGIRESFRRKLEDAFSDYVSKYKKLIETDEFESFKAKLGVSIYAEQNEFYGAIRNSDFFKPVRPSNYIGKTIPDPDNKYLNVTLLDYNFEKGRVLVKRNSGEEETIYISQSKLEGLIRQRELNLPDIDIPLKLRLAEKFHKDLKGTFTIDDLTVVETFERINNFLPEGHALNNQMFTAIRKQDSFDSDNSYAHYSSSDREIYLSSKCMSQADIGVVDIHSGKEIASTLIHEIGHAVSTKLGRRGSIDYRKFTVECGWSWEQFQIGQRDQNFIATGSDPDIRRLGTKSDRKLITDYAGKSPEEAFAEYYSVYSQYKARIDSYLETGKTSFLEKDRSLKVDLSKKHFREFQKSEGDGLVRQSMRAVLTDQNRNLSDHIRVDAIDPYNHKMESVSEKDVLPAQIAYHKRDGVSNKKEPQPVFTVFDYHTGNYDLIKDQNDAAIHYSNKYLRRNTPTFSISKECYNLLSEKGFDYGQIKDFVLHSVKDEKIPDVLGNHKKDNLVIGLNYRGRVIPKDTLHSGRDIFTQMKKIWESDDLRKALVDLNIFEDTMEKSEEFNELKFKDSLTEAFKPFLDVIGNVLKNPKKEENTSKKNYSDVVLRNEKGEILLLKRSTQDDFMPGKWWLPGGKIDPGEDPITAAERELFEESGIDMKGKLTFLVKRTPKGCTIHYFEAFIDKPFTAILDNEEHFALQWVSLNDLDNYDLLDTKESLLSLPTTIMSEIETLNISQDSTYDLLFRKEKAVSCLFNMGHITDEKYLELRKALKNDTFTLIQASFNKGEISEEKYFNARKLVN